MINILKSYQYTGRPLVYIELWRIPTNTSMHTSALIKKDFSYKRSLTHKVSITPKGSNSFIIKSLLFIRIIMHFAGLFKSKQPNYSKLSIFKQKTNSYMFKCLFYKLLDFSRNQQNTFQTWIIYNFYCISKMRSTSVNLKVLSESWGSQEHFPISFIILRQEMTKLWPFKKIFENIT